MHQSGNKVWYSPNPSLTVVRIMFKSYLQGFELLVFEHGLNSILERADCNFAKWCQAEVLGPLYDI
jgi:hypothetical protein